MLNGSMGTVAARLDGISNIVIYGVRRGVDLTMSGVSRAFVQQSERSKITGYTNGLNEVVYSGGSCEVNSPFSTPFMDIQRTCIPVRPNRLPSLQVMPTWTCGVSVEGNFT